QNTVSAGPPNPVYAGQPNPVSTGNGILGPRPLNIQSKTTYFHSFTHNNQQIIFPITYNSLYSLYMTGGLNGKTAVKPSASWAWTESSISITKGSKINGGSNLRAGLLLKGNSLRMEKEIDRDLLKVYRTLTMSARVLNFLAFKLEEIFMAMMTCLKSSGVHYQCFTAECGLLCCDDLLKVIRLVFVYLFDHQSFNSAKCKGFKVDQGALSFTFKISIQLLLLLAALLSILTLFI
nr:hypothetical protein [Tanacetum cinerariifolium]